MPPEEKLPELKEISRRYLEGGLVEITYLCPNCKEEHKVTMRAKTEKDFL